MFIFTLIYIIKKVQCNLLHSYTDPWKRHTRNTVYQFEFFQEYHVLKGIKHKILNTWEYRNFLFYIFGVDPVVWLCKNGAVERLSLLLNLMQWFWQYKPDIINLNLFERPLNFPASCNKRQQPDPQLCKQ